MNNVIEHAGWKVHWRLTESSGLMVYLVDYHGRRVLWEGSLPYVTVDHQRQEFSDEDSEDAAPNNNHGPFWVPLGERTLAGDVRVSEFRGGFELAADFHAGPYRYTQLWRFHEDGRLGPWLTIYGPGVHDSHTYHPHWRFDFDIDGPRDNALERFDEGHWVRVEEEGWFPYGGERDKEGNVWRQIDFGSGAAVSIRPHTNEDAELFAIRYREGEWAPFSPRNEEGSQPFPAAYVGSESLDGQDVMLWYVAHVHYASAFPVTAGPWIQVTGL
jgi:Cu2+-containing amine oxidase